MNDRAGQGGDPAASVCLDDAHFDFRSAGNGWEVSALREEIVDFIENQLHCRDWVIDEGGNIRMDPILRMQTPEQAALFRTFWC